jgi:hypothetical protein
MKIKKKKRKKYGEKGGLQEQGVEGIFSKKKKGQKIKIYCDKRERIISTGKGMRGRRREDLRVKSKVREKGG